MKIDLNDFAGNTRCFNTNWSVWLRVLGVERGREIDGEMKIKMKGKRALMRNRLVHLFRVLVGKQLPFRRSW